MTTIGQLQSEYQKLHIRLAVCFLCDYISPCEHTDGFRLRFTLKKKKDLQSIRTTTFFSTLSISTKVLNVNGYEKLNAGGNPAMVIHLIQEGWGWGCQYFQLLLASDTSLCCGCVGFLWLRYEFTSPFYLNQWCHGLVIYFAQGSSKCSWHPHLPQ